MPNDTVVTIEDGKRGEILIDRDTCERIFAFDEIDKDIRHLTKANVFKMEVGKAFGDIILSVTL
jgi:hypothetical protein